MVALNVQCSMFNGESSLQLPASRTAALVATLVVPPLRGVIKELLLLEGFRDDTYFAMNFSTSEDCCPNR